MNQSIQKYINQDIDNPTYLFHGSPKKLEVLKPNKSHDSHNNKDNVANAVFLFPSFIKASAYAFKDTIKENSKELSYNFTITNNNETPVMIMENINIDESIKGYIYVVKKDDTMIKDENSYQYKCNKEIIPIDVIEIKYKAFKQYYENKGGKKLYHPILETDRLILKRGTIKDYLKVYEYDFTRLRNINGEFEFVENNQKEVIEEFVNYADEENYSLDYILYLKNTKEPIGNITLDRYDEQLKSLEISCNLHPNYWRQGYTTEALLEIMDYVFNNLDVESIIYEYAEENYKSKGVSDKIGFKYLVSEIVYHKRINKDIKEIKTIMNKEDFYKKYDQDKKR